MLLLLVCVSACLSFKKSMTQFFISVVLAGNFPITQGSVDVEIPWVLSDADYTAVREYHFQLPLALVIDVCFKFLEILETIAPSFLSPDHRHLHPNERTDSFHITFQSLHFSI